MFYFSRLKYYISYLHFKFKIYKNWSPSFAFTFLQMQSALQFCQHFIEQKFITFSDVDMWNKLSDYKKYYCNL